MIKRRISYLISLIWLVLMGWLLSTDRTPTKASGNELESAYFVYSSHGKTLSPEIGSSQSSSADRPVEQVRKNIQVLKGLPASQLFPLMNFVSASLGVRCAHCHVNNGGDNWVWESDDKETKRVARRMMQMVIDLNKNNQTDFRGGGVTCYTCHRAQTDPQRIPALPLTASKRGGDGATGELNGGKALTAEQVLNRYVEAVGGRAATEKLKTLVMKGEREASEGRIWAFEVNMKRPDKFLIAITIPQQGLISQAFNGQRGWLKNTREQRAMTADELAALKQTAELYEVIKIKGLPAESKAISTERIDGREAYVVELTPTTGKIERWYFDVQTGLLLRRLTLTNTVLAPIPEQIDFEDYREVDGVKLPFVIRISDIDPYFNTTRRITEIRPNLPLDDARFNPPAGQK